jgi:hypothetical protein
VSHVSVRLSQWTRRTPRPANAETDECGPVPIDSRERELWAEERRGAGELLASLAEWDVAMLRLVASPLTV